MAEHPVFGDIRRGDLEEVQRRVLSDPGVLEEELGGLWGQKSPLTYAIHERQTSIALWLIEHRGQHNLDTLDERRLSAIVVACLLKDLPVVKARVAAGADTANAVGPNRVTPLIAAAMLTLRRVSLSSSKCRASNPPSTLLTAMGSMPSP